MDVGVKMGVKKYFIAIVIPEPVYSRIEAIKQQLLEEQGLKGALRSPSHITLHRPFVWKEEREDQLIQTLNAFRFEEHLQLELQGFSFFEPRVVYVKVNPNQTLDRLYNALKLYAKRELRLYNEWEDLRGFHPHVTIANRDLKKPKFYELLKEFENRPFSATFTTGAFALLALEKTWKITRVFHWLDEEMS